MPQHEGSASPSSPKPFESPDAIHEVPGIARQQEGSSDEDSVNKGPALSKRKRLSNLKSITKAKTKKLFKVDGAALDDELEPEDDGAFEDIEHNPAFHTSALVKEKRIQPGKTADKNSGAHKVFRKSCRSPSRLDQEQSY